MAEWISAFLLFGFAIVASPALVKFSDIMVDWLSPRELKKVKING